MKKRDDWLSEVEATNRNTDHPILSIRPIVRSSHHNHPSIYPSTQPTPPVKQAGRQASNPLLIHAFIHEKFFRQKLMQLQQQQQLLLAKKKNLMQRTKELSITANIYC